MAAGTEVERLFRRWLSRTVEIHHAELKRLGVIDTGELDRSVKQHFRRLSEGYLEGGLMFDEHGRFVDMGSGRGYSHGRRIDGFETSRGKAGSGRRKQPWYSRVWYARVNDLQGAVGFKLMEEAVDIRRRELSGV